MKACDLLLQLEAYLALESALGFPLGRRERQLRDLWHLSKSAAPLERSVPKSLLIGLVQPPTVAALVEKQHA
jgi:hypothetical protein